VSVAAILGFRYDNLLYSVTIYMHYLQVSYLLSIKTVSSIILLQATS